MALVRSERLNPTGLHWQRFVVAVEGQDVAGAVQIRDHADGSHELGSLVVRSGLRGTGVAARMIDLALSQHRQRVLVVTYEALELYFKRWGFRQVTFWRAPRAVQINYCMGRLACIVSLFKRRRPRRLIVLDRNPAGAAALSEV